MRLQVQNRCRRQLPPRQFVEGSASRTVSSVLMPCRPTSSSANAMDVASLPSGGMGTCSALVPGAAACSSVSCSSVRALVIVLFYSSSCTTVHSQRSPSWRAPFAKGATNSTSEYSNLICISDNTWQYLASSLDDSADHNNNHAPGK